MDTRSRRNSLLHSPRGIARPRFLSSEDRTSWQRLGPPLTLSGLTPPHIPAHSPTPQEEPLLRSTSATFGLRGVNDLLVRVNLRMRPRRLPAPAGHKGQPRSASLLLRLLREVFVLQ